MIGGARGQDLQIPVIDQNATVKSDRTLPAYDTPQMRANGRKLGYSRIGFIYENQVFPSTYDKQLVQVPPYSTTKVRTHIIQTISQASFMATFTMQTTDHGRV